jgi:hypothetical protein
LTDPWVTLDNRGVPKRRFTRRSVAEGLLIGAAVWLVVMLVVYWMPAMAGWR